MNLSLTLRAVAQHMPDGPAISWDEGSVSYGALEMQVQRIAGALRQRHRLEPGARVAVAMENCPELLPALYGIWRAGLTAVPINSKLHAREMAWIIADSQTRLCLASPKLADGLSAPGMSPSPLPPILATGTADYAALLAGPPESRVPADAGDEAWLFYTSGTTGRPKGAVLTHRNLLFACQCYYADIDFIGPQDTSLHAAPLTHGAGLYGLAHLARGSHNVILSGSFDPERVLDAFAAYANVSMFAAPTMVVAPHQPRQSRFDRHAGSQDHRLRRRADVRRRLEARTRAVRPQALPALRPGRDPDDHHRARQGHARGHKPSPIRGAAGQRRRRAHRRRRQGRRRGWPGACRAGEIGEIVTTQRLRDERLLEQPRGQRQGPARRLAVDRRPRLRSTPTAFSPSRTAPRT